MVHYISSTSEINKTSFRKGAEKPASSSCWEMRLELRCPHVLQLIGSPANDANRGFYSVVGPANLKRCAAVIKALSYT